MKTTDGTWFVSGQTEVISMPSQCNIAKVSGWNYEQAQANAKLIAAAPEMLEMLIRLDKVMTVEDMSLARLVEKITQE